jgi:hypothetical protein
LHTNWRKVPLRLNCYAILSDANMCFRIVMAILGGQFVLRQPRCRWAAFGRAAVQFFWLAVRVLTIAVPNILTITISNGISGVRVPHAREQPVSA